ncbi:RNA polymerase sigma factor [Arcanobacterium hippocoleae]|uniref:RNA polymerase sigma factor n=1 Tax=Arcanobacterium hippocoleae TaxID=149017 RepID=UPI00334211CC
MDAAIESGVSQPVDPLMLTPEDAVIEAEEARERAAVYTHLRQALGGLTERQREIVTLHFFENHSVTEIAELLGISKPAVSKQLKAAISNLRKTMVNKPGACGSASESSTQNPLLSLDVSTKKKGR